jgi:cytochrome c oxidase cbb3-type subunit 3
MGMLDSYRSPWYDPQRDMLVKQGSRTKGTKWVEEKRETDTTTYIALSDERSLESGKKTFERVCSQCHGMQGQGGIGPNLTDDYWIHGAGMTNVTKSVKYGYPDKGMIAWRAELPPVEIMRVSSFVMTLHGTNPPNPKAPQGDLVAPAQ